MDVRWILRAGGLALAMAALLAGGCAASGDLATQAASLLDTASTVLADSTSKADTSSEDAATAGGTTGVEAGPPGGGPGQLGELLGLTDEQETQAQAIHEQLRTDIDALVEAAEAELVALLTEDQVTQLDGRYGILLGVPPHHGGPPGPPPTAEEIAAAESDPNFVPPARPEGAPPMSGPRRPMGGGHERGMGPPPGPPPTLEELASEFSLTDEQVAQIGALRDALKAEINTAHETAKSAFKALLTAEQLVIFEALEANRPAPPDAGE